MRHIYFVSVIQIYHMQSNQNKHTMITHQAENSFEQNRMLVLTGSAEQNSRNPERNEVYLQGSVVSDVTHRRFANGNKMASFAFSHGYEYTSRSGERMHIYEVFEVVSWNRLADVVSSGISKGAIVKLRGRLRNLSWIDRQGKRKNQVQIIATEMYPLAA